ncbi:hypothetical protein [Acidovorax sp. BLS4]|uniref:hypothetical protein n=1 Tax=Acidovorax sp. BLS4 TaxID=3273430 RepID=UPI002941FC65|nr:hypothetical protein [Paracidovorax avenae]WOI47726.1 hypothetical protein R1Z03_11135 [Paracidovorax avenae]
MPDDDEQQYLKFRTWMLQPGSLPERRQDVDGLHGMQALIEDALWAAWQAGYLEGQQREAGPADE